MNILKSVLASVLVLAVGVIGFVYSGIFNVAATQSHDPVSSWLLETTRERSIEARLGDIQTPDLSDEKLRLAGVNDFDSMCAECHTAPGRLPSPLAQGLNPPAPDLAEAALEESVEMLFWATKYGIRMTGMPSWGVTHDDDDIWPVIAFLQVLPDLDGYSYQEMLESAEGEGHHAE